METKRPFLFLLPAATLSFPPAMDPGGDLGETIGPLQHQEGGPRIIAVRKLGSLGLFFFSRCYWVCRTPASSCYLWVCPESLQDFPCIKNSSCLSFCLVSVSYHWGHLCLSTQQIFIVDYRPVTGHGTKDRKAPCSQGIYQPMEIIEKQSGDFRLW